MFARTKRLTLRPAWPEDAPELAHAIAHETVARMLVRVPYPYTLGDAESFSARAWQPNEPRFLILAHEGGTPRLVGGIGIHDEVGPPQLGYWLTPDAWGKGYATEAGRAVIELARHALAVRQIAAWHFLDNPASGRVLTKLGFRPTGAVIAKTSLARQGESLSASYLLDLADVPRDVVAIAA